MLSLSPFEPVDYLVIGHITKDLTPAGPVLGGTASYAALTACALGLRVGIVTYFEPDFPLSPLKEICVVAHPTSQATTFENIQTPRGRVQILHHQAPILNAAHIPAAWRNTPIVHLGPVAREIDEEIVQAFPNSFIGATPQGWMRQWDENGHVSMGDWPAAGTILRSADAAVISIEDVRGSEDRVEEYLSMSKVLVVTEGAAGCRLYWNGDVRSFKPPQVAEVDPTGAGDIFATAFFVRYQQTRNPWEAARFATQLASISVTRKGVAGVPTREEVQSHLIEILK